MAKQFESSQFQENEEARASLKQHALVARDLRRAIVHLEQARNGLVERFELPDESELREFMVPAVDILVGTHQTAEASYTYVAINGTLLYPEDPNFSSCEIRYLLRYDSDGVISDKSRGVIIHANQQEPDDTQGETFDTFYKAPATEVEAWEAYTAQHTDLGKQETDFPLVGSDISDLKTLLQEAYPFS